MRFSTLEAGPADHAKRKTEQTTEASKDSPENQVDNSRTHKLVRAFSETFQRVFQPEKFKTNKEEQQLRDELVSRGFLRQEAALGMDLGNLQRAQYEIYKRKSDLIDEAVNYDTDGEQKIEEQKYFNIHSDPRLSIRPGDSRFNYLGDRKEYQEQWAVVRLQLDQMIPDDKFFTWQQMIAARKEQARIKEMRDSWAEYQQEMEKEWPGQQRQFEERVAEKKQQVRDNSEKSFIESWPMLKEAEEKDQEYIDSLCKKETLTDEEQNRLKEWLYYHKEFGLQEMSDEEYNSFFQDGRFYAHFSYFFADNDKGRDKWVRGSTGPKFIEALKDGFLIARNVGKARGEQMTGVNLPEDNVSFDNNDIIFSEDGSPYSDHSAYAQCSKRDNFPVVLVAPASMLENHAFYKGFEDQGAMGRGEGYHFGSENPNPESHSHEIDMSLFTMLVPDSKIVSADLLRNIVSNLESFIKDQNELAELEKMAKNLNDYEKYKKDIARRDYIAKNPEIIGLEKISPEELKRLNYLNEPEINISTQDFMANLFFFLKKEGVHVPRLYFYQPKYEEDSPDLWKREAVKTGLKDFLAEKAPKALSTDPPHPDNVDLFEPRGYMKIPEGLWADRKRTEEIANEVRRVLKKQQTEAAEKEVAGKRQEAQSSEDLAAIEKVRNQLQNF